MCASCVCVFFFPSGFLSLPFRLGGGCFRVAPLSVSFRFAAGCVSFRFVFFVSFRVVSVSYVFRFGSVRFRYVRVYLSYRLVFVFSVRSGSSRIVAFRLVSSPVAFRLFSICVVFISFRCAFWVGSGRVGSVGFASCLLCFCVFSFSFFFSFFNC